MATCTTMSCASGHVWTPTLELTPCPGCKSPLLAIKMVNCPICNEPSVSMELRADHVGRATPITPICQGSASTAEIIKIALKLSHAADTEQNYKDRQMPTKV